MKTANLRAPSALPAYAEFGVQSNFSFLRGASRPEELVVMSCALGYTAMGLADRNTVAGVVRGANRGIFSFPTRPRRFGCLIIPVAGWCSATVSRISWPILRTEPVGGICAGS